MTTIRKALVSESPHALSRADLGRLSLAQRITAFLDSIPVIPMPGELEGGIDDSWWDVTEQPRIPANQHARLGRLRRTAVDTAITKPGAPFKVVLYATAPAGQDPAPALTLAERYSHERGWHVVGRFVDEAADTPPWTREEWPKALRTLRGGFAQGLVTIDRTAVSPADEPYEKTLHWLLDHFSFVAHVRPYPAVTVCA
ncbi:hypothetical protein ACLB9X_27655 [Streptomyces sp. 5K101]|uniref:hypothetical protein n=1 Tax=Streptomyces sp. 5K101 TaxID=3390037 RepID=UPI003975AD8E